MYEAGGEAVGVSVDLRLKINDSDLRANIDPFQNVLVGPLLTADGVLAPKPMPRPDDWEPMGDLEYRALYYALCKFNQLNRTGIEWKAWGPLSDEIIYSYPSTMPFYFTTMFIFLDVFTKICGPTARKARVLQESQPDTWQSMITKMQDVAGGGELAQHNRLSARQFLEMSKHWRQVIGVPQDLHAALSDFLPGMCNIFRLRKCAVMHEYNAKLAELGCAQVGSGRQDLPQDCAPRGKLFAQAALFSGDGSHRLGMMKAAAAELPRLREKLDVAQRIVGYDVLDLCINGPAEKLESQEHNGVAMYLAGWAAYEKFLSEDPENARRIGAVAGMDVGEYVALSVAGVIPFEVGLELALTRGKAIQETSELIPDQAVCSVAGLAEERVEQLCQLARASTGLEKDVCQIATLLFNKGYVVSGRSKAVNALGELAQQEKALQVKVMPGKAIHTPLMHPVQWAIKAKLREHRHKIRVPWCDVYFNANGTFHLPASGGDLKDPLVEVEFAVSRMLCETCWSPLRWELTVRTMLERGITHFFECGPTKQLKQLMKRIDKEAFANTGVYTV